MLTIQEFLGSCPQSPSLCDLLMSWSSHVDPLVDASPPLSQAPIEGSSTHATQATSDCEDDQNRYGCMMVIIPVQPTVLTPRLIYTYQHHFTF